MIADHYLQLRTELETALSGLLRLASDMHRDPAMLDTIHGLATDIREPLLFVVVGEVKAGKSSLLNALFGQEFAKVDVLPATDRVYVFKHGEEESSVEVSPMLTERYLPIKFLLDFNVVDTPGTNTMVAQHQTITENFVPRADLVLFVFSVLNPWTKSSWNSCDSSKRNGSKMWSSSSNRRTCASKPRSKSSAGILRIPRWKDLALSRRSSRSPRAKRFSPAPPVWTRSGSGRKADLVRWRSRLT